ncbi:RNA polymerase sigma factor [Dyadobacter sediminis]|uniref:Sigma-70 family RNA polymerase sigma factor n=1 Tax=Dyadobacter sediminis TaxID=1493691 RepID=A0A5R9KKJ8_9BACT|nr:sigma-70 family RNA polymerase sigma factor [Dyadobacter sediminis]TLU96576.1 sigma-70 family RNA polymerase sigma factor [Dyadobacter sediminis]GGB83377.1 hypothetical protein GCM10011325_08660 [Dyadobacter sediminis]
MKSTPFSVEDRMLWQNFLVGDVRSFEKLMSDHFRLLFRYGSKFSKDREFVKDSIQDLFMMLWEKRDNLNPEAAVKPYLMASLRRLMHRQLSERTGQGGQASQEVENYFAVEFSVEEQYIADEVTTARSLHIQNLISTLPRRQKEVVYLKFFQELSRDQIAQIMNITPQTVSNLLQIAIRQMKEFTKEGYVLIILWYLLF